MKLESLKNASKFTTIKKSELIAIKGGQPVATGGSGTIKIEGKDYAYKGDVKDNGHTGYWIPKLVKYHWVN